MNHVRSRDIMTVHAKKVDKSGDLDRKQSAKKNLRNSFLRLTSNGVKNRIINADALAAGSARADAISIAEAAYRSIDTDAIIRSRLVQSGSVLTVGGREYDLSKYSRVKVIGFGKVSCKAVQTIENLLKQRISEGVAIDVHPGVCDIISVERGTHPRPSPGNVVATEKILNMAKDVTDKDLFIAVVSGGGSSLLCWPSSECEQGGRLYDDCKRVGSTIDETNLVRKHISDVKGGGLAKFLYPATVIGLIFCDVPGDHFEDVASGPTYYDSSTIADAQAVLDKYGLKGYTLNETPKEAHFFERVNNVQIVSNTVALDAMSVEANRLGYTTVNVGASIYDHPSKLIELMYNDLKPGIAVIAGGEPSYEVKTSGGKGGRCQYVALEALKTIKDNDVLLAFSSDGIDNSDSAGAIADKAALERSRAKDLSIDEHLNSLDTYGFFEQTGDLLFTGSTDSNVSDLFVLLRK